MTDDDFEPSRLSAVIDRRYSCLFNQATAHGFAGPLGQNYEPYWNYDKDTGLQSSSERECPDNRHYRRERQNPCDPLQIDRQIAEWKEHPAK